MYFPLIKNSIYAESWVPEDIHTLFTVFLTVGIIEHQGNAAGFAIPCTKQECAIYPIAEMSILKAYCSKQLANQIHSRCWNKLI